MQLIKKENKLNLKEIQQILISENKYFSDLFSVLTIPSRNEDTEEEEDNDEDQPEDNEQASENEQPINGKISKKTRAKSIHDLQNRLETITTKKQLTYKDKVMKKGLKNRMKKKNKQDERNAQKKLLRVQQSTMKNGIKSDDLDVKEEPIKPAKPVFNSEGKMVFSKFDFSNLGKKTHKKQEKDPKKLLDNLKKQDEKVEELKQSGELKKAIEMKEKVAWKNALLKAQGEKVKDDPMLLKKTIRSKEQQKKSSKKKWQARQEGVSKAKDERQKKREENINKRKHGKKINKMKNAAKRGKIIPGF